MLAVDRRVLTKLEPVIRRVLVVDPNPMTSKVIADVVKGLGSHTVFIETTERRALSRAAELEPCLIFTEYAGVDLDGAALVRRVRRSNMDCRRAPVIMVSGTATAASIKSARDVGVHEYLRKPFTTGDIYRRIEAVSVRQRDWIEGVSYVGPDRRRFNSGEYAGPAKRRNDQAQTAAQVIANAREQAIRILAAALDQFDNDPTQAVRAIREQSKQLKLLAMSASDTMLVVAVGALEVALASASLTKVQVKAPINHLLALYPIPQLATAR